MMIVLSILALFLLGTLIHNIVKYSQAARHEKKSLTQEERDLCARIVDRGIDIPWVCRKAVETGSCPCLPCEKLNREKQAINAA